MHRLATAPREKPGLEAGRQSGVTLIEIVLAVGYLALLAAVGIPTAIQARKERNEASAISSLRTLQSLQAQFREGSGCGRIMDYASDLAELSLVGLIDGRLGSGSKDGYIISLSGGTYEWQASATPVSAWCGTRNFFICTDGVIRFSDSGPASGESVAVE